MIGIPGFNASALTPSPALKSVAEETINLHKWIEAFDWHPPDCYGCGGPHPFMKFGKINCPNAERPGCKENAEKTGVNMWR